MEDYQYYKQQTYWKSHQYYTKSITQYNFVVHSRLVGPLVRLNVIRFDVRLYVNLKIYTFDYGF